MQFTDKQLLELISQSEIDAFDQLYKKHWHKLFLLACKKLGSKDDAADIIQETFIEIWDKREKLQVQHEVLPYLVSIVYHKIFSYFRKKGFLEKHSKAFEKYLEQINGRHDEIPDALIELENNYITLQEVIDTSIQLMPEKMRKVLLMHLSGNYTIDQIAENLNVSRNTVKSHLYVSMVRLRKTADEHAINLSLILLYITWKELILS